MFSYLWLTYQFISKSLNLSKYVNNISGLQTFQILRFAVFLAISIVLSKSTLSLKDIGDFEYFLFLTSALSFFWANGIIQSFLPLYHNNSTFFKRNKNSDRYKSPEIFNAFILLTGFSLFVGIILLVLGNNIKVYKTVEDIPYLYLMLLYILITTPTNLVEYIYLVRNKPNKIVLYGITSFSLQLFLAIYPVLMGWGIQWSIYSLLVVSGLRFIWLVALVRKYAKFRFSLPFIQDHLRLGAPLIISSLLSGSAQYIDGLIVSSCFSPEIFAIFRYGAKEVPFVIMMANGLNNAMLTEFRTPESSKEAIATLKRKSKRLMHILFPISILLLLYSNTIYISLFNTHFGQSSDIFMIYILLITSRLVFPQTILIGLKKTRVVMTVSVIAIIINIILSLFLIKIYGITGVALATVVVYVLEKTFLIIYNSVILKIKASDYIPLFWHITYSVLIILVFVLIDHRIIMQR